MPIDIVVDGMGSDKAPEPEVRGAVLACRHYDVRVHLTGPPEILKPALEKAMRAHRLPGTRAFEIHIVPASEWISMDDKAAQAVRTKRDSSMRVGLKMVRDGTARGFYEHQGCTLIGEAGFSLGDHTVTAVGYGRAVQSAG